MAPTRHWDTCSSNPGVGGIFSFLWPFSVTPYCLLGQVLFLGLQFQFGNSKTAAHVAVRPSALDTVKPNNNNNNNNNEPKREPMFHEILERDEPELYHDYILYSSCSERE